MRHFRCQSILLTLIACHIQQWMHSQQTVLCKKLAIVVVVVLLLIVIVVVMIVVIGVVIAVIIVIIVMFLVVVIIVAVDTTCMYVPALSCFLHIAIMLLFMTMSGSVNHDMIWHTAGDVCFSQCSINIVLLLMVVS